MHGQGLSLSSWVHYRKLLQREQFEKLCVKTFNRKSLPYKNWEKLETGQHTSRAMEKCHQQGTFRDHHGSHFPGKPGLSAGTTGLERDPVHPVGQGHGAGLQESPALGQTGWRGGAWLRCRAELSQERMALADFIFSSSLKLK